MTTRKNRSSQPPDLRQRAEVFIRKAAGDLSVLSVEEVHQVVQELQVHQIELEMQNEELRRTQLELEASRDQYADLYDFAPIGYLTVDPQGIILKANLATAMLFGVERVHLNFTKLTSFMASADSRSFHVHLQQALTDETKHTCEFHMRKHDGSMFYARMESIGTRNAEGHMNQCRIALIDITEQRRLKDAIHQHNETLEAEVLKRSARIQELEQRRMQIDKLAALSQIAAGVAHEINNPLASIRQAMQLVKQAVDPGHPYWEYVGRIEECISRMARITKQMYNLVPPRDRAFTNSDVRAVVKSAMDIMEHPAEKRRIHLRANYTTESCHAMLEKSELVQVLCNLIQNGLDASRANQEVTVTVIQQGDVVAILVSDKGSGVSAQVAPHIFEPFFTTKTLENRMGMGLSLSRSMIEAMGGVLHLTSTEGQGSLFTIKLQASPKPERV